jgi:hypothetical protein
MSDEIIARIDALINEDMERHPPVPPPPTRIVPKAGTRIQRFDRQTQAKWQALLATPPPLPGRKPAAKVCAVRATVPPAVSRAQTSPPPEDHHPACTTSADRRHTTSTSSTACLRPGTTTTNLGGIRAGTDSGRAVFCGHKIPDLQTPNHRGTLETSFQPKRRTDKQPTNHSARFTPLTRGGG